jgi:hypothetical protein
MKTLLFSGLVYLIGIAILLALKPSLMFDEKGQWKEFGIGRDTRYYTWMPFWLFAIMWAILSYLIVLTVVGEDVALPTAPIASVPVPAVEQMPAENVAASSKKTATMPGNKPVEMKPGYYVLDIDATSKKGIPKYIYLGQEAPNLIYNAGLETE